MVNTNDNDIEIPDEEDLSGFDETTDWKTKADELQKKHREAGARNRERTKALKEKIADLERSSASSSGKNETKSDELGLLQKGFLRSAGIADPDEVELALTTSKKWDMPVDKLVDDEDFKVKLEKLRTTKSNEKATTNIRGGGGGTGGAKDTIEYWLNLNQGLEKPLHIPADKKLRTLLMRSYLKKSEEGGGRKFYNDPK